MRASTVLCSHMFIFAESPIKSAGQPNSVASSLRAAKLLSMSRSFSRSTMEVRQLSFCGLKRLFELAVLGSGVGLVWPLEGLYEDVGQL